MGFMPILTPKPTNMQPQLLLILRYRKIKHMVYPGLSIISIFWILMISLVAIICMKFSILLGIIPIYT